MLCTTARNDTCDTAIIGTGGSINQIMFPKCFFLDTVLHLLLIGTVRTERIRLCGQPMRNSTRLTVNLTVIIILELSYNASVSEHSTNTCIYVHDKNHTL